MNLPCWVNSRYDENKSRTKRLTNELNDFIKHVCPTESEIKARQETVARTTKAILNLFPKANVSTFGSFKTGLFLPHSDIDILVSNVGNGRKYDNIRLLRKLSITLRLSEEATGVEFIEGAKVPIVKFFDRMTSIQVDICLGQTSGLESSMSTQHYITQNPYFKPLVMFLKYFLAVIGHNETYKGGLGSFLTGLLVHSYLQLQGEGHYNIGSLLIGFFDYFGNIFNFYDWGISILGDRPFVFRKDRYHYPHWPDQLRLVIEMKSSEAGEIQYVGGNSFLLPDIIDEFRWAYELLLEKRGVAPTLLSRIIGSRDPRKIFVDDNKIEDSPGHSSDMSLGDTTDPESSPARSSKNQHRSSQSPTSSATSRSSAPSRTPTTDPESSPVKLFTNRYRPSQSPTSSASSRSSVSSCTPPSSTSSRTSTASRSSASSTSSRTLSSRSPSHSRSPRHSRSRSPRHSRSPSHRSRSPLHYSISSNHSQSYRSRSLSYSRSPTHSRSSHLSPTSRPRSLPRSLPRPRSSPRSPPTFSRPQLSSYPSPKPLSYSPPKPSSHSPPKPPPYSPPKPSSYSPPKSRHSFKRRRCDPSSKSPSPLHIPAMSLSPGPSKKKPKIIARIDLTSPAASPKQRSPVKRVNQHLLDELSAKRLCLQIQFSARREPRKTRSNGDSVNDNETSSGSRSVSMSNMKKSDAKTSDTKSGRVQKPEVGKSGSATAERIDFSQPVDNVAHSPSSEDSVIIIEHQNDSSKSK